MSKQLKSQKKRLRLILGITLIFVGIVVLQSTPSSYALTGIDTVPPTIVSSTPFDISLGYVDLSFMSYQKYSIHVQDWGSGVGSVTYEDALTQTQPLMDVPLSLVSGTKYDGVWEYAFGSIMYAKGGEYNFKFTVVDIAGKTSVLQGTFKISYGNLQGVWSINNIQISDPSQEVWLTTNTVTFKFVKGDGAADSEITCSLSGGVTAALDYVRANTWMVTRTLSDGVYDVTMTAEDTQGHVVAMSIYQLGSGGSTINIPSNWDVISALGLFGVGGALCLSQMFKRKKHP